MKNLKALIESKQYAEAKAVILENRDQIEDIADILLSVVDELQDVRLNEKPVWYEIGPKGTLTPSDLLHMRCRYDTNLEETLWGNILQDYGSEEIEKSDEELRQERKQAFEDQSRMVKRPLNDVVTVNIDLSKYVDTSELAHVSHLPGKVHKMDCDIKFEDGEPTLLDATTEIQNQMAESLGISKELLFNDKINDNE